MSETNSITTELVTMLTVCVLIDRKDILLDVFRNEDIAKGVLVSGTHVKPRSVHTLNKTTFLVTYSSGMLAEEIGSAIQKIDEWCGKPVVIMCDEEIAMQLPKVIEHVHQTIDIESVVFNSRLDEMRTDSNPSVCSGYHSYAGNPAVWGHLVPHSLIKYQAYHTFLVQSERRTLSDLNSGSMLSQMPGRILMNNW